MRVMSALNHAPLTFDFAEFSRNSILAVIDADRFGLVRIPDTTIKKTGLRSRSRRGRVMNPRQIDERSADVNAPDRAVDCVTGRAPSVLAL